MTRKNPYEQDKIKRLQIAKDYATSKGGECLSSKYLNANSHLEWKCANPNHEPWFSRYGHIVTEKRWCRRCASSEVNSKRINPNGLQIAKDYAISKGGQCLSQKYENCKTLLEWKCGNNEHDSWFRSYTNTVTGCLWCRKCSTIEKAKKYRNPHGLKVARDYAISRGGKCLSSEYIQAHAYLEWKCHDKVHSSWLATHASVTKGNNWCPKCGEKRNVQEFRVRNILNYLLDTKFIKNRKLKWNFNPKTNRLLELDGYSEKLSIAFEFQGRQHFELWYSDELAFRDTQFRDLTKKENCINNNVKLIIITEKKDSKLKGLLKEIFQELERLDIKINKQIDLEEVNKIYLKSENNDYQIEFLNKAKEYATNKGGECISTEYINQKEKLEWKCNNKLHFSFFRSYNSMLNNKTNIIQCPECFAEKRINAKKY